MLREDSGLPFIKISQLIPTDYLRYFYYGMDNSWIVFILREQAMLSPWSGAFECSVVGSVIVYVVTTDCVSHGQGKNIVLAW